MRILMISLYVAGLALVGVTLYWLYFGKGGRGVFFPMGLGLFLLGWAWNIHRKDDAGEIRSHFTKDL